MLTKKHLKMIAGLPLSRYGVQPYTLNVISKARHGSRKLSMAQRDEVLAALKKISTSIGIVLYDCFEYDRAKNAEKTGVPQPAVKVDERGNILWQ